jgi:DNA-binding PadR family transcriptional regulator
VTGKDFRLDFVELHILHHASEEPRFGLWMIEELRRHGYKIGASQLYPKFHRLEQNGLLRRRDEVVNGKLRKYYRATASGRRYLRQQKRRLMELVGEALSVEEIQELLRMRRRKR